MEITVLKCMLKGMKIAGHYLAGGKSKRSSDHRSKKGLSRLTIAVFLFFAGVCLIAMSKVSDERNLPRAEAQKSSISIKSVSNSSNQSDVNDSAGAIALRTSSAAKLVLYPDRSSDAFSSTALDKTTQNQLDRQNVKNSDVATSQRLQADKNSSVRIPEPGLLSRPSLLPPRSAVGPDTDTSCEDSAKLISGLASGRASGLKQYIPGCNDTGDFLTAGDGSTYDGALFAIPFDLTTQNQAVESLVGIMQGIALILITPIIALIGISYMTGRGSWRFADALESLPRLILAAIGVATCLVISEQIIIVGNILTAGFMQSLHAIDPNLVASSSIIIRSGQWQHWLTILSALGGLLMLAAVVAPAGAAGFIFGPAIAVPMVISAYGAFIGLVSHFVETGLSMAIAAQIIVRIILINVYIVLSPVAMIAAGLPGQDGVRFTREWIMGFLSLIASQFATVVAYGLGREVLTRFNAAPNHSSIVSLTITYATLALMVRVPGLFRSNAVGLVSQVGPIASNIVHRERSPLAIQ